MITSCGGLLPARGEGMPGHQDPICLKLPFVNLIHTNMIPILSLALLLLLVLLMVWLLLQQRGGAALREKLIRIEAGMDRIEQTVKSELAFARAENQQQLSENRKELSFNLQQFSQEQGRKAEELRTQLMDLMKHVESALDRIGSKTEEKLLAVQQQDKEDRVALRKTLSDALKELQSNLDRNMEVFNKLQKEKLEALERRQESLVKTTELRLEDIRHTVEEKLEKTLSDRLGQSFETVGKQLLEVQRGLGEMQTLAGDVGGLKKVLSNVKLRGGVGEVQLALILEQMLAPAQYEANVRTRAGSSEPVEFAVKLPGRSEEENSFVYLPIDAKFPKDVYETLLTAYEQAVPEAIDAAVKNLEQTIRKMARDIRDKYLDPPHTTDFAILFLPFESIYAEVIRRSALVDQLRDEFRITVAGPTTLVAILNSLQMGFRTLALQQRSSEVWKILAGVKTEFSKFGGLLEKTRKNLHSASDSVDELLGRRSRAISRKLQSVESLPNVVRIVAPDTTEDGEEGEELSEEGSDI